MTCKSNYPGLPRVKRGSVARTAVAAAARASLDHADRGRQEARQMTLDDAIAALYAREINCGCETFWDGGVAQVFLMAITH